MTFKLSPQLDSKENPNVTFQRYRSYINENRNRFPDSALKVIEHPNWSGGSSSKAPYYSHLISMESKNLGQETPTLKLLLQKDMYVEKPFLIAIEYKNLLNLDLSISNARLELGLMWRYEQFLYVAADGTDENKPPCFMHQIEWVGGKVWSITAGEIHVDWL